MSEHLTRKQMQCVLNPVMQWAMRPQISVKQFVYTIKFATSLSSIEDCLVAIKNRLISLGFFIDGDIITNRHGQNSWHLILRLLPIADFDEIKRRIGTHLDVKDSYLRENFGRYFRIEGVSLAGAIDIDGEIIPCLYYKALPVNSSYLSPISISALQVNRYIMLGDKTSAEE